MSVVLQKHIDWNPSPTEYAGELAVGFHNLDFCFPSPASVLRLWFI